MNIATAEIYFNPFQGGKDGRHSISIKVTFNRERKYYRTQQRLTKEEYLLIKEGKRLNTDLKKANIIIKEFRTKAQGIIDDLRTGFSWERFEKAYQQKKGRGDNAISLLEERAKELRGEGRISTANSIECTAVSLEKFNSGKNLPLRNINPQFLKKYERWMLEGGNSYSTCGIYLRNLRAVFNIAIQDGIIPDDSYPFNRSGSKDKYQIPKGKNTKKAIPLESVARIYHFVGRSESEEWAKDLWLFSYFANGMNLKDIGLLKYKNIDGKLITFIRSKTKNSKKGDQVPIKISLLPQLQNIIDKWGDKMKQPDSYIFQILKPGMDEEEIYKTIQLLVAKTNKYMNRIAKELKIEVKLNTYVARHTFSTVLKKSGKSSEFIADALGHSDPKTTQNYLSEIDEESVHEMANELIKFPALKEG